MGRRRSSLLDEVSKLPWPVGVVLAALCYPGALLFSAQFSSSLVLKGVGSAVLTVWPLFSILFLMAALISFLGDRRKASIFKTNKSIDKIRGLSWQQFESYVGSYFKSQGYFVVETPSGPDGGVDLVLRKDGERTYVQCKHWKKVKVGVEKVRELLGAMAAGGADFGVFVTTGEFTASSRKFGRQHGIRLIDGKELECLLRVTPGYDLSLPDNTESNPSCPVCDAKMIKRTAKKGANVGQQFWGCSRYPSCRGTRQ